VKIEGLFEIKKLGIKNYRFGSSPPSGFSDKRKNEVQEGAGGLNVYY
jgi:hypothetical protein